MSKLAYQILALVILLALAFGGGFLFAGRNADSTDELVASLERAERELDRTTSSLEQLRNDNIDLTAELDRQRKLTQAAREDNQRLRDIAARDSEELGDLSRDHRLLRELSERDRQLLDRLEELSANLEPP